MIVNVFAMKRSGTHGIVNWIASMFQKPVYFFDNCTIGINPMLTRHGRGDRKGTPLEGLYVNVPRGDAGLDQKQKIKENPDKNVIVTYMNTLVQNVDNQKFLGECGQEINIVILRDFHNWTASLMNYRGYNPLSDWAHKFNGDKEWRTDAQQIWASGYNRFHKRVTTWIDHAEHYFELTDLIFIPFNEWFEDECSRRCFAARMDLKYSDVALRYVGAIANEGSSFDLMNYDGIAHQMDVLNRWKKFEDNQIYWDSVNQYPKAVKLSRGIFGRIT